MNRAVNSTESHSQTNGAAWRWLTPAGLQGRRRDQSSCLGVPDLLIYLGRILYSPLWAAPFPEQGILYCGCIARVLSMNRCEHVLFSLLWVVFVMEPDASYSYLDFSAVIDCNLELSTKTSPFSPKLLSYRAFYHNRKETRTNPFPHLKTLHLLWSFKGSNAFCTHIFLTDTCLQISFSQFAVSLSLCLTVSFEDLKFVILL